MARAILADDRELRTVLSATGDVEVIIYCKEGIESSFFLSPGERNVFIKMLVNPDLIF